MQEKDGALRLVSSNASGEVSLSLRLSGDASGLAATANGVATVLRSGKRRFVTVFDQQGEVAWESELQCYATNTLLTIRGNPVTPCGDGSLIEHPAKGVAVRRASWMRQGTLGEVLSSGKLAIIDQSTGVTLLNDLATNQITPIPTSEATELAEAIREVSEVYSKAEAARGPGSPQMGKPLVVMDTAQDASGWYVLVWPYHPSSGPAVMKFDNSGRLVSSTGAGFPGIDRVFIKLKRRMALLFSHQSQARFLCIRRIPRNKDDLL